MIVAGACGVFVAVMVGAAYAAVPFYNWFCRTTGFAGTPQIVREGAGQGARPHRVRAFRFQRRAGLPWRFEPEQNEIKIRIGQVTTVHYKVINEAAREITAQASYNVSPPTVGAYFDKINCFCFTQQTMKPGETREMTVVFYVDPAIVKDHDQDDLNTITLSYTFYRLPEQAAAGGAAHPTRIPSSNGDDDGRGPRKPPRLPPGRSEPVAGGRPDFGLHPGGRRHQLDASDVCRRAAGVRRRRRSACIYTFIAWWRDVIREAQYEGFHTRVVQISHRYGMILFIASEVMFFVAWFWAYFNTALFPGDAQDVATHRLHPRRLAAGRHRDLRSLASAAVEHADPAHLRHHGDLGASRAARERPRRA